MANMRRWVNENNISVHEMAELLGTTYHTMWRKLSGDHVFSTADCLILRAAYGLSADFVMDLVAYDEKYVVVQGEFVQHPVFIDKTSVTD
ncbi:hypothetical protein B9G54_06080 [Alloscardovia macacae]|uniref:HTH cro/C1-type domain-containing protein n=1 Tax=Alloscardovia macacae TaxID=1160091 RepID=A0A1Y2T1M7_9BIFI|nr:hypothetical protein [Alloscardovia macacae]OTA26027.1 hypothetical protein B9G54_06080 [Alloscardovia macacae]OTA29886.1 hypothetical protein B9T39_02060 [Alloscardovia macacae]